MAETSTSTPTKVRRLNKDMKSKFPILIIEVIGGNKGPMEFDYRKYPPNVQEYLPVLGLNHRLGDAAAGKAGPEAEEAILKVAEGLAKGDLTVRAPASPKISKADVRAKLEAMSPKERKAAEAMLKAMGISV